MVRKTNTIKEHIKIWEAVLVTSDINIIKTGTPSMNWFWNYLSETKNCNDVFIGLPFNKESLLKSPRIKSTCFVTAE